MKKVTILSLATLLFCSAFTLLNQPSKDILGKWKVDASSLENTTKAIINTARKNNPDVAQQMEDNFPAIMEMVGGIEIIYKSDNTYETLIPQQVTQSGKWELAENGHSLLVTPEGKPQRKDSVLEISATKLRIFNRERGDTTLYIHP